MKKELLAIMVAFSVSCFCGMSDQQAFAEEAQATYCANEEDLLAAFAAAHAEQADSFRFQCSAELLDAILEG